MDFYFYLFMWFSEFNFLFKINEIIVKNDGDGKTY